MISIDCHGMAQPMIDAIVHTYGFPMESAAVASRFTMQYTQGRLQIIDRQEARMSPLAIDFEDAQLRIRQKAANPGVEQIAKAIGLKRLAHPSVLDTTAGLGTDAYLLATLGCRVLLAERCAALALLLEDAMARARNGDANNIAMQRMCLIKMDAGLFLTRFISHFDVIYLDPMYPHRKKSALPKLAMRILRDLVGDDTDAVQLLQIAMRCARYRVVVKRPIHAPQLGEQTPSFSVKGRSTRFDVYQQ